MDNERGFPQSNTSQQDTTGVEERVLTLLRKKNHATYLVRKVGGGMHEPTGWVEKEEYKDGIKEGGRKLSVALHIGERENGLSINVAQPFSSPMFHQEDEGCRHASMSIPITTEVTSLVGRRIGSEVLVWKTVEQLRELGKQRQLSPALLQCMMLGMM